MLGSRNAALSVSYQLHKDMQDQKKNPRIATEGLALDYDVHIHLGSLLFSCSGEGTGSERIRS